MISDTKIYIKGMVCGRCISVITSKLGELGITIVDINLGEVTLRESINEESKSKIIDALQLEGFELLEDKNRKIVDKIKAIVRYGIELQMQTRTPLKFSTLLTEQLHKDYNTICSLFSIYEGV